MRIGIAWVKALLPVGFVLVAAATASAQYAPSPYAPSGAPPYAGSPYGANPAQFSPVPYDMQGGAGMQPIFYDQGGFAQPGMPEPEGFGPPPSFNDAGADFEGGVRERGQINIPFLGQPRVFGTGGITHPRWFDVSADYMIFSRDDAARFVPLSAQGFGGPIVLSTDNLNMPTSSGFRVTGNYLVGVGRNIEGSFFGAFNWNATANAVGPNGTLFSPFSNFGTAALTGFDTADRHSMSYSTNLNSAELNLRQRYVSPNGRVHTSALVGVRYLSIDEDFLYVATSGTGRGSYLCGTSNDLIGFQAGGDLCVALVPRFKFGVEGKAGVYGNDAQLRNTISETTALAGTINVQEAANANNACFVGEAGCFMVVHLHPKFNLKAGYQCLVATGLALAPENLDRNPNFGGRPLNMNVGGSAFYHGGQAGFEYIY